MAMIALMVGSLLATPATTRVLDVPWHHQEHNLSCEAAALEMALSYYGITVDEMTLMRFMTIDARPAKFDVAGKLATWGDPAQAYVGNPDGSIQRYQGYGAYNEPVARAAATAGATVLASGSGLYAAAIPAAVLYRGVLAGHPSVAWISNTYRQVPLSSYVAYDGATVRFTLTEHAVTIIGVSPEAVLIDDPWFGRAWHPKAQFESAYRTFAGMAVVVGAPA